jgi:hypothetical protein
MTEKEILKKALKKAKLVLNPKLEKVIMKNKFYYSIIFDQEFAKHFWGNRHYFLLDCGQENDTQWEQNLMKMVLEPNPIQYLAKFLEKKGKGR